jgi:hypothetical protein
VQSDFHSTLYGPQPPESSIKIMNEPERFDLVRAYGTINTGSDRLLSRQSFEDLCQSDRSFRISKTKPQQQHPPRNSMRETKRVLANKTAHDVYNECQSSINSYRAKKSPVVPDSLERSKLELATSIQDRKAKLNECNDKIKQHTVQVPAMRVLRNLLHKLYEADNYYMRLAFLRLKQYNDHFKKRENAIRLTAQIIKSKAMELVRKAISTATEEAEEEIKRQILENTSTSERNVERWNRTKSMYNMKSDSNLRGSLFRLPNAAKYKSKLLQKKKLLSQIDASSRPRK